jgi:hypothetical protein
MASSLSISLRNASILRRYARLNSCFSDESGSGEAVGSALAISLCCVNFVFVVSPFARASAAEYS